VQRLPTPRMAISRFVLVVLVSLGGGAVAQTNANGNLSDSKLPQFDVASIRPTESNILNALLTYPGGRVEARGATLEYLLMEAFSVQPFQISGGPSWIRETRFDIEAKPPESIAKKYDAVVSNPKFSPSDEQRKMLQRLLMERFQLKIHFAETTGFVYVLTTNGRPLRLQAAKDPNAFHWAGSISGGMPDGDGLRGINISMPELSARLSDALERPVEDHTGLKGNFDFEAANGDEEASSTEELESSIFTALKSVGLELKKGTGPVPQLVVDEVSRPSEN
jgi:uncharacterized protein (TIGR03435 family)